MTPLDALVLGDPSPRGTLALHGAGGAPEANFPFLPALSRTGRVVAPYWPGTGPSPRSIGQLRIDDLADAAVAAADAAGLERFDLLGYSLGAAVAVRLAARHPARVDRLVLTAGFARPSPSLRLTVEIWLTLLEGDPLTLGRFLAWLSSSEQSWNAVDTSGLDEVARRVASGVPPGTPEQVDLIRRVDVRADLLSISAPTLVIAPRHDRLVDRVPSTELVAGIPHARLVDIDGGHLVATEASARWWELVAEHLHREPAHR